MLSAQHRIRGPLLYRRCNIDKEHAGWEDALPRNMVFRERLAKKHWNRFLPLYAGFSREHLSKSSRGENSLLPSQERESLSCLVQISILWTRLFAYKKAKSKRFKLLLNVPALLNKKHQVRWISFTITRSIHFTCDLSRWIIHHDSPGSTDGELVTEQWFGFWTVVA